MEQLISLERILTDAAEGRSFAANDLNELLGAHATDFDKSRLSAKLVLLPTFLRDKGPAVSERILQILQGKSADMRKMMEEVVRRPIDGAGTSQEVGVIIGSGQMAPADTAASNRNAMASHDKLPEATEVKERDLCPAGTLDEGLEDPEGYPSCGYPTKGVTTPTRGRLESVLDGRSSLLTQTMAQFKKITQFKKRSMDVAVAAVALVTVALVAAGILLTRQELGISGKKLCHTKDCLTHANLLLRAINTSIDPCEDLYGHVCSRWLPDSRYRDHAKSTLDEMMFAWYEGFNTTLSHGTLVLPVGKKVRAMYDTCMASEPIFGESVAALIDLLHQYGLRWPEASESNVTALGVLIALDVDFQAPFCYRLLRARFGSRERIAFYRPVFCATNVEVSYKALVLALYVVSRLQPVDLDSITDAFDSLKETLFEKINASGWLDVTSKRMLGQKISVLATRLWPLPEFLRNDTLEAVYFDFPDNETSFGDYWVKSRLLLKKLNNRAPGYEYILELPGNNSPKYVLFNYLRNSVDVAIGAVSRPLFYPQGTRAMTYVVKTMDSEGLKWHPRLGVAHSIRSRSTMSAYQTKDGCLKEQGFASVFPEIPAMEIAYAAYAKSNETHPPIDHTLPEDKVFS
ncbi:hypothetical protein HPB49_026043 [Dermacentor silvarum]|nr:hypothetical protein HPB49_026043 [Dermacentor silvarum]